MTARTDAATAAREWLLEGSRPTLGPWFEGECGDDEVVASLAALLDSRERELLAMVGALREALAKRCVCVFDGHEPCTSYDCDRFPCSAGPVLASTASAASEFVERQRGEAYDLGWKNGRDYEAMGAMEAMESMDQYDKIRAAAIRARGGAKE